MTSQHRHEDKEKGYRVSHASSKKVEYYVVRFDDKEFSVEIVESQRHHKDYPEITKINVKQTPNMIDESRVHEILEQEGII